MTQPDKKVWCQGIIGANMWEFEKDFLTKIINTGGKNTKIYSLSNLVGGGNSNCSIFETTHPRSPHWDGLTHPLKKNQGKIAEHLNECTGGHLEYKLSGNGQILETAGHLGDERMRGFCALEAAEAVQYAREGGDGSEAQPDPVLSERAIVRSDGGLNVDCSPLSPLHSPNSK